MKYIVVQWKYDDREPKIYDHSAMRVVCSNHPRFKDGTRFDYGFMGIASDEGYVVTVLPSAETLNPIWKDGYFIEEPNPQ